MQSNSFHILNISDKLKHALEDLNYTEMTPIQQEALPHVLEGRDVIAQAPTGTGKTACFAVPSIELIDPEIKDVQVLVLCPTRELAIQVAGEFKKLLKYYQNLKVTTVYGGQDIEIQLRDLKKHPQIVIATPGRAMDHLRRKTLKLDHLRLLVLDEADEMLNMGFKEDLDVILESVTSEHQTILFSATMSPEILKITKQYQKDAQLVKTTSQDRIVPDISQSYIEILEGNKTDCLSRLIDTYNFKQALVFCRTKRKVDDVSFALTSRGYKVECIHGDMKQASREKVIEMFRAGVVKVLIATDVAARGLDIQGIDVVFNYDITDDVEYYIHRIGRTARAGRDGSSITFVLPKEVQRIVEFSKKIKRDIIKVDPPSYQEAEAKKVQFLLDELIASINVEELTPYINYLYESIEKNNVDYDIYHLAAAFLRNVVSSDVRFKDAGLDLRPDKNKKSSRTAKGYARIFITVGRVDDINKSALVDLICRHRHVSRDQIQGIEILNTYSFFEIPETKREVVMNQLSTEYVNGRQVRLDISTGTSRSSSAEHKKHSGEGERRERRPSKDGTERKRTRTVTSERSYDKDDKPRRRSDKPFEKETRQRDSNIAIRRSDKPRLDSEHKGKKRSSPSDTNESRTRNNESGRSKKEVTTKAAPKKKNFEIKW